MRKRKRWFLVAVVVLALGLGYIGYLLLTGTPANHFTVSQLKVQTESIRGQTVVVEGKIAPGSINWDNQAKIMRFALTENGYRLDVVYQGIVDDSFKPGSDLVAVGTYGSDGIFTASSVGRPGSLCSSCH